MDAKKALKVKVGTCRRTFKELKSYEAELTREQAKAESMRSAGADSHDMKQQDNVVGETQMMLPDCRKRLEHAFQELQSAVESASTDPSLQESAELKDAQAILAEVEPLFDS